MTSHDTRAIRCLLHHLGDADALRGNALVAEVLPSLELDDSRLCDEILNRVRRGVDALGERCGSAGEYEREIVRRCDLERTEQKVVIADLGISRRAFYYHRRRALRHLAASLRRSSAIVVHSTVDRIDAFDMHVRRAASFAALGHAEAATAAAARAEAVAITPDQRVHACALLAEYAAEAGHGETLAAHLGRLENELSALEKEPGGFGTTAWLEATRTSAVLRWRIRGTDPLPAFRNIGAVARSARIADAAFLESRVRVLLTYADFANVGGTPIEARAALDEASPILGRLEEPVAELRARLAIVEAVVSLALLQPISHAADRAAAALDVSVRYGLVPYALDASALLAIAEVARGRAQSALDVVRAARPTAISFGPHEAGRFFFLSAARVCATAGALDEARSMLALADEQQNGSSDLLAATQQFTRAVLTLADGRPGSAVTYATEAMRLSERYDLKRMKGRALGVRAQALAALGRKREAHSSAIDAIAVLERYGTRHTLASMYELSATLANDTRYKRHAQELRSAISS